MERGRVAGIGVGLALLAMSVWAESRARIVYISFLTPPAEVSRELPAAGHGRHWSLALMNAPVVEGESVRTGEQGRLEIEFECGSAVRFASGSRLTFSRLRRQDDGDTTTTLTLDQGRFFFNLRRADTSDFHVILAGARLDIPKGAIRFQAQVHAPGAGSVSVAAGEATLRVNGASYDVTKSSGWAWDEKGSAHPLPVANNTDPVAAWSHDRDRAFERAMSASRLRSDLQDAQDHTLPAPASTPPIPPAWSILSAGADTNLQDPLPPALADAPRIPACARY